ncbi:hypothetical protein [Aliikangiella coralliicola]|uniref:Uncharacterized protein n=1 Tax=Aliikangiella coralliicola TaxID=2592383 RepID=A0A545UFL5_9GAMM|nr:hypothetical protein [Aliikangiella coralliicola]TQV88260.1 hypothetical protein FLL46_06960 [Aliikangiella coralliicola]
MKATFIKTEGDYLQAELEIAGMRIYAMDEFGGERYSSGEEIEVELTAGLYYEEESWESMFSGNPDGKKELEHLTGWSYRVYGVVNRITPEVMVDVGFAEFEAPVDTRDQRVIGESIAFTISRMDAYGN